MIPSEAVEAAARAMSGAPEKWDRLPEKFRADYREVTRTIIEAAAPYMMAAAWSTCSVESARCGLLSAADALLLANLNPYRNEA